MPFFLFSFLAGILTVLAPCVFPILPVIIGGCLARNRPGHTTALILSLACSIGLFTLLLKGTTLAIGIPSATWQWISGLVLAGVGLTMIVPEAWDRISLSLPLRRQSERLLDSSSARRGLAGSVLVGAALGLVFVISSPAYGIVLGSILPGNFWIGAIHVAFYTLGLVFVLLFVAMFGQSFIRRFRWTTDPNGGFRRGIGVVFFVTGLIVCLGWQRPMDAWLRDRGWNEISSPDPRPFMDYDVSASE